MKRLKAKIFSFFKVTGYFFPTNEKQLDRFEKKFKNYKFESDEHYVDPFKIINSK